MTWTRTLSADQDGSSPVDDRFSGEDETDAAVAQCPLLVWIEMVLVDETDTPYRGEAYEAALTDGRTVAGPLGGNGACRHDRIPPGTCSIVFPEFFAAIEAFAAEAGG